MVDVMFKKGLAMLTFQLKAILE